MAQIQEKNLTEKAEASLTDFLRVVGEDGGSYRTLLNEIARAVIENYNETTLYGSAQSVRGAFARVNNIVGDGSALISRIYPVGSIYMSVNDTNPATLFGGEWERIQDTFLLASGTNHLNGSTGGEETHSHTTAGHTLTVSEMPSHTHAQNAHYHTGIYNSGGTQVKGGSDYCQSGSTSGVGSGSKATSTLHTANTTATNKNTGGGQAHSHGNTGTSSNMPPYLAVNVWKRIA